MSNNTIELAAVTGAHGVAGEVRLKLFGEGVEALSQHKTLIASKVGNAETRELKLGKIRSDNKGGAVARFKGVDGRNAAEGLRGYVLSVSRDDLPALGQGEYYHADLIGLSVVSDAGDTLGTLIDVANYGATDILEIEKSPVPDKGMKTFMVPMTPEAVIEWDETRLVIAADFVDE